MQYADLLIFVLTGRGGVGDLGAECMLALPYSEIYGLPARGMPGALTYE